MAMAEKPTILVVGGGSGGHITPVLAVAHQIKELNPAANVVYVGQTGDILGDVAASHQAVDEFYTVRAGKFRRYHGAGWQQIFDIHTMALNIRDAFFVVVGILQSYRLLRRVRPQAIFTRGSFVSVPIALAASMLHIPYITHDSDAIPSLANRLIAKRARLHAVALPKELYPYPPDSTRTVGIPIAHEYRLVDAAGQAQARERLGLPADALVLLLVGGGLGAQRLNEALAALAPALLSQYPRLVMIVQAGRAHEQAENQRYDTLLGDNPAVRSRVQVLGFVTNMIDFSAAADVVVARAGGTNIAELAAQGKACIIVPNPELTGGHQPKNAKVLADRQAAVVISEEELKGGGVEQGTADRLLAAIVELLNTESTRQMLGKNLHELALPDAARELAVVLLDIATDKK
jgi:UDP-N-acetylglucosamine--N-acetylmuramyl-(pentapeptide) pyrophosphoryl-undecaprenol N-acetylglucosamine transferase